MATKDPTAAMRSNAIDGMLHMSKAFTDCARAMLALNEEETRYALEQARDLAELMASGKGPSTNQADQLREIAERTLDYSKRVAEIVGGTQASLSELLAVQLSTQGKEAMQMLQSMSASDMQVPAPVKDMFDAAIKASQENMANLQNMMGGMGAPMQAFSSAGASNPMTDAMQEMQRNFQKAMSSATPQRAPAKKRKAARRR